MHFSGDASQPPPHIPPLSAEHELLCPDTFQCQECPGAFTPGMTPHLAVECPLKRHLCVVCGRQFALILALTMHMSVHVKPQTGDVDANGARTHDVNHGKQTPPPDPRQTEGTASRGFPQDAAPTDMDSVDVASTSCPAPQLHRCSICSLLFVSRDKLWLHCMCVHEAPSYTCDKCLSCFEKEEELVNHTCCA
ncbi:hypothetical protein MTO96_041108 [Rhipicephalus appendiculatus]